MGVFGVKGVQAKIARRRIDKGTVREILGFIVASSISCGDKVHQSGHISALQGC
jgi:hypothetical protein